MISQTRPLRWEKGSACFYCRNSLRRDDLVRSGTHDVIYDCALGIDNSAMNGTIEQVIACPSGDPRQGFQIGGYYTHMWFTYEGTPPNEGGNPNGCLLWHIASDGESPTHDGTDRINFHLCDFEQLEAFVAFWRTELERRGWLTKDEEAED